jgi:hypothetical protein
MKVVVFFDCEFQYVETLVKRHLGEYEFVVIIDPSTKTGRDYPEQSDNLEIVRAEFLNSSAGTVDVVGETLARGDYVIVHKEFINPYLARYYDFLSESAKRHAPSREALEIASDKGLMRQAFAQHCPTFTTFSYTVDCDSPAFDEQISSLAVTFPLIIKPANNMSSLFVRKVETREEFLQMAKETASAIADFYIKHDRFEAPTLVIEGFLEGTMYTVASWVDCDGKFFHTPIIRAVPANEIGIAGFHLFCRHTIENPGEFQAAANLAVEAGANAMGLRCTSLHSEFILTKDGFKLVEIGARVGGHRQWMFSHAYGIDCYENDFLNRIGQTPSIDVTFNEHVSMVHLYPEKEGRVTRISGIDQLRELDACVEAKVRRKPPFNAKPASRGGTRAVEVKLAHHNLDYLIEQSMKTLEVLHYDYE